MMKLAGTAALVYAAVSILGGVLGGLKGSTVSIVAGVGAGVVLAVGGWLILQGKWWGTIIVGVACLALVGRFLPSFLKSHAIWPAGTIAILGVITIVLAALALIKR